jgi:hypothetical protein
MTAAMRNIPIQDFSDTLADIGGNILDGLKSKLGAAWDELNATDRALLGGCAIDAARLQVQAMAARTDADKAWVQRETAQVNAQLANAAAIAEGKAPRLAADFWSVVEQAAAAGIRIGVAALVV